MIKHTTFIQIIAGYLILTLGVSLIILSNLGAGAWDTVYVGLFNQFGLTIGTWSFLVTASLIFFNALLTWEKPQFKSFIGTILASLGIDFWMEIVFSGFTVTQFPYQVFAFFTGIILLGFGVSIYIRPQLFSGPIDGLMIATAKRLNISIKSARIINEFLALALGLLLGGPVGLGTLIVAIFLGYAIQYGTAFLNHLKDKGLKII
ncbi:MULTISPECIES: YczE/YyaS/YitT family protein [unclassified Cytobacillus]|uniref:YczE/YyaS/YitT family protein n=1 Tax=unclassified Cytobacillus TaxID=2675268 RepID=UPI00135A1561|nr:hypothetical protein [Cytobacillus sp. AMY 15.2]KAF0816595.1 putative membrane protein [Bacillus sp. ZZV12-4809]MCM3090166.1 hypothetical protein [Cytobacillus sp. AMY 15.2]